MTDEKKQSVSIALSLLKTTLQEEGILIGAQVDKKEPEKTKLIFLDKDKYLKEGKQDGFTVEFDTLNI